VHSAAHYPIQDVVAHISTPHNSLPHVSTPHFSTPHHTANSTDLRMHRTIPEHCIPVDILYTGSEQP
jgi:hypothetical protein